MVFPTSGGNSNGSATQEAALTALLIMGSIVAMFLWYYFDALSLVPKPADLHKVAVGLPS